MRRVCSTRNNGKEERKRCNLISSRLLTLLNISSAVFCCICNSSQSKFSTGRAPDLTRYIRDSTAQNQTNTQNPPKKHRKNRKTETKIRWFCPFEIPIALTLILILLIPFLIPIYLLRPLPRLFLYLYLVHDHSAWSFVSYLFYLFSDGIWSDLVWFWFWFWFLYFYISVHIYDRLTARAVFTREFISKLF
jgi:hypothetical protein